MSQQPPANAAGTLASRADALKVRGNAAYTARRFEESITLYSRAILLATAAIDSSPSSSATAAAAVLFSNRAAAWMGLKRWEEAKHDCRAALALDATFEKASKRRAAIEKEQATHPHTDAQPTVDIDATLAPADGLSVRTDLPRGVHSGLFASRSFGVGEGLFASQAAAVIFDSECDGPEGRTSRDLLHAVLIAATIDPSKHAQLGALYPSTDEHLQELAMVSLDETAPEEVELFAQLCADAPDTHPALIIPPYARLVRFTCGRFTPRQIHLLHHQVLYNSFSLANRGGGGKATAGSVLYPTASRLNHSCWPNAFGAIVEGAEQVMTVRAIRPIEVGQEITISYLNLLGPRTFRRKTLWETFEFVCQCQRCVRDDEDKSASASSGHAADEQLESIVCTNASCTGSEGTRSGRGVMVRVCARPTASVAAEQQAQQQASGEYLPFDEDDTFQCRDCKHTVSASEVATMVSSFSSQLAQAGAFFQQHPRQIAEAIGKFTTLLTEAEFKLVRPAHYFLPQLYSALGGLHFQRAMQLQSQQSGPSDAASIASRQSALDSARRFAEAAYHGSRRVLVSNSALLVPLLLTAAACCEPAHPARLDCVQEAYRIHHANYGGGLALFQTRYAADLNRLQMTREVMHAMRVDAPSLAESNEEA